MKVFLFLIFLYPTLLFANPLLDIANDGPRWIKTSTILDCRKTRKNSMIPEGKIGLGVHIIDVENTNSVYYTSQHAERKKWNMFEYKVYEEDSSPYLYEYKIKDVYEDKNEILFIEGRNEYVFSKKEMLLSTEGSKPRECRYL